MCSPPATGAHAVMLKVRSTGRESLKSFLASERKPRVPWRSVFAARLCEWCLWCVNRRVKLAMSCGFKTFYGLQSAFDYSACSHEGISASL